MKKFNNKKKDWSGILGTGPSLFENWITEKKQGDEFLVMYATIMCCTTTTASLLLRHGVLPGVSTARWTESLPQTIHFYIHTYYVNHYHHCFILDKTTNIQSIY